MDKIALAKRFEGFSKVFAEDSSIGVDLKAMSDALVGMTDEKFASIVNSNYEAEAFVSPMSPDPQALQNRVPMSQRPAGGQKNVPTDPMFSFPNQAKLTQVAQQNGVSVPQLQGILEALKTNKAASEEKAPVSKDNWSKEAFNHVANNLVRDVLGMNKSVCCDTGRKLDKKQMPDATKAPETKGVRPTDQDTGRALTPEQIPSKAEALASDMYKKSKGPVKKEAAEDTDVAEAEKTQAEDSAKDAAKASEAERLEKLEKAKAKADAEDKKKKLDENKIKKDQKDAKEEEEVEAGEIFAEGISFDNVMSDSIDANDPEIKKLSSLFE